MRYCGSYVCSHQQTCGEIRSRANRVMLMWEGFVKTCFTLLVERFEISVKERNEGSVIVNLKRDVSCYIRSYFKVGRCRCALFFDDGLFAGTKDKDMRNIVGLL